MAKAVTRIKFGSEPEKREQSKGHLHTVEAGEDVPDEAGLSEETKAAISEEEEFVPAFDPDDPSSYEGEEAARHSKLMAPDNPNRPRSVPGEDSWKVTSGGFFGRPPEQAREAEEKERPQSGTKARGGKASARERGRTPLPGQQPGTPGTTDGRNE